MIKPKASILYPCLFAMLLMSAAISLVLGPFALSIDDLGSNIGQLRTARILTGMIIGAALSVAGAIFQALLRNPLAEPYVLGVSSGAGVAAATSIIMNIAIFGAWTLPVMAFVGAIAAILLVLAIARSAGGAIPVQTLLLAGVVVGSVLGSGLMFLVNMSPNEKLPTVMWWLMGSLQLFNWSLLQVVAMVTLVSIGLSWFLGSSMNILSMGEEPAAHLGLNVERTKIILLALASLMTGCAVAACGLIGFVGLIVPHSVRSVLGPDHRRLIPSCALCGAAFVVLADSAARSLFVQEIPIGAVTAFMGGPFFLLLLKRGRGGRP